ncbi:ATP-dependent DNA ligase [Sphingomonas kaistensis]|uniref:DNA ligase (ATP) n=1 Tax=Sphingomonas kaistensis TaxID=298708 RepID=A0A7X5Y3Z0_9SPHN|nr:ATP-dependent DNA ligase [Sphingomonas kaistensis]NJC04729.1 ATP-dependent DNA ligase [Sphingomonas kaistensis]
MTAPATMEALLVDELPAGSEWRYEPKWDGFRCLALRTGGEVALWSRSGKPLGRYFPEIETLIAGLPAGDLALDGELVIETADGLSFDALSQRLHPAESRVRKLAAERPALFIAFDLLGWGKQQLEQTPLAERRQWLERLVQKAKAPSLLLSPQTGDIAQARDWLKRSGGALDGVIAKRSDEPYRAGERAMLKIKHHRSADCVVGGYRSAASGGGVASLLLGLYGDEGLLHHVGFCSSFKAAERREWAAELAPLGGGEGFTGNRPDKPSRWSRERTAEWVPLRPELVVEVLYDQVTNGRFRHGTRLLRRRPDKRPDQCRCEQLSHPLTPAGLADLLRNG